MTKGGRGGEDETPYNILNYNNYSFGVCVNKERRSSSLLQEEEEEKERKEKEEGENKSSLFHEISNCLQCLL